MKYYLSYLLIGLFCLPTPAQNPIIKEETFTLQNGQWIKNTILERQYQANQLASEKTSYFDEDLKDWLP